jgi:hypothetical protein
MAAMASPHRRHPSGMKTTPRAPDGEGSDGEGSDGEGSDWHPSLPSPPSDTGR